MKAKQDWATWYYANRTRVLAERREKYHNDEEFRLSDNERGHKYYADNKVKILKKMKTRKIKYNSDEEYRQRQLGYQRKTSYKTMGFNLDEAAECAAILMEISREQEVTEKLKCDVGTKQVKLEYCGTGAK